MVQFNCHFCKKSCEKTKLNKKAKKHYCSKECQLSKNIICSICHIQIDISEKRRSKTCCNRCTKREWIKKFPERYQESLKKRKDAVRIKKGLPLDHPPLKNIGIPWINKDGYMYIRKNGHPNSQKNGTIYEHVFVMSEYLGRPLYDHENVHHKNGIRNDNRIENLELWNKQQPYGQRVTDKIKFYKEFIEQYGGKVDLDSIPKIFYDDKT